MSQASNFYVETFLDKKKEKGLVWYLVKWRGYPASENTWETRKQLIDDGLKHEIAKYEAKMKASGAATPAKKPRGRSPAPKKKTPVKKSPAKKSPAKKSPAKKSPAKKSPAKKAPRSRTPSKKKAPTPVAASPAAPTDASPQAASPVAAGADAAGDVPLTYANVNTGGQFLLSWLALFSLSIISIVAVRVMVPVGGSDIMKYVQLCLEVVPPGLCVLAVWHHKSTPFSDLVGAALAWMVALPALENVRELTSAEDTVSTASLIAVALFQIYVARAFAGDSPSLPVTAFGIVGLAAVARWFLTLVTITMEPFTLGFLNQSLIGATLLSSAVAVCRVVAHIMNAPNGPLSPTAFPRWVGLSGVVFGAVAAAVTIMGTLGVLPLNQSVVDSESKIVTERITLFITYNMLRWLATSSLALQVALTPVASE